MFVETILHKDVTGGCGRGRYCPTGSTTREAMAVFVLVFEGSRPATRRRPAAPRRCSRDVPASSPFCRWVEELARRGVVAGCGGGNYCPVVVRHPRADGGLRAAHPGPGARSARLRAAEPYADVPETSAFCRWIEELARRSVVTGCGGGNYCPAADVTREQMAVFLAVTFGLKLYGI